MNKKYFRSRTEQFDRDVVRLHSECPGQSPLREDQSRTNLELTNLVREYIEQTEHEFLEDDPVVSETYRVLSEFVTYLAYRDKEG